MRLIFDVYDYNKDGFIDEIDLYCVMKLCDFSEQNTKNTDQFTLGQGKINKKNNTKLPLLALPETELEQILKRTDNRSEIAAN